MTKLLKHIRRWNKWRKDCLNSPIYKFFVLIGFIKSPTMPLVLLDEERDEIQNAFMKGVQDAANR